MMLKDKIKWFDIIRKKKQVLDKVCLIDNICREKKVLDVGCVGQDFDFNNPNWVHKKIHDVANALKGVDINIDGIKKANEMGFNVCHQDELDDEKFDVVMMLDVIEHVDNPVGLLKHYSQFLRNDGLLVVTTPNSNRVINFLSILFRKNYSVNDEHTFWLCPKTFMEILRRVETLDLADFFWLDDYNGHIRKTWKKEIMFFIARLLNKICILFAPNLMFVMRLK